MGEVYRATDPNLGRQVAIKVLPDAIAHDPERVARFEREARTLATLNHPHIAIVHGFEKGDGLRALVMELVEGPTLAERIAQGPIPLDEALPIAKQIAEALEAAHEHGIVHRDLKPANVKLRPDGTVKVLDFGLAKVLEPAESDGRSGANNVRSSQSPTITSPAGITGIGVLLGTAAYMSPEQAKGRAADRRSDLWAFGCVLYEMLTGTRTFEGDDVSDTLAAVLRAEPDWTALPPETPKAIRRLLRHCLAKDPKVRIGDASTARIEIMDARDEPEITPPGVQNFARRRVRLAWTAGLALGALAVGGSVVWMLKPASAPLLPLTRFAIPLPAGQQFSSPGHRVGVLSPDGTALVYSANERLHLRAMDQLEAVPIRGTEGVGDAVGRAPFFSPDGRWIGYWQGGQLKKVSLTGGAPIALCPARNPWGANWTAENTILYGQGPEGIWRVSADGGKPENVLTVDADQIASGPQLLPGGRAILFTLAHRGDQDATQIVVHSLDTDTRHVVLKEGTDARFVSTGHLLYVVGSTLLAVPFDVAALEMRGGAVPLVEDVARSPDGVMAYFSVSNDGDLVYVPTDAVGGFQHRTLVWVDRQGHEVPIKAAGARAYFYARLSPDGARIVLDVRDQETDLWILDVARETLTLLTVGPERGARPVWTPDGKSVIYNSSRPGTSPDLFQRAWDGTGTVEQLTQGSAPHFASAVTPDGKGLIFGEGRQSDTGTGRSSDLMLLPLAGERRPQPLMETAFAETNGDISPDGQWLAYQSNESGQSQVYVRPFPNVATGRRVQVSTTGGGQPLWARNGRELFYESQGALMRVAWAGGPTFVPGTPSKLFDAPDLFDRRIPGRQFDISPDGQRFLMTKAAEPAAQSASSARLILVQHWFEELKRRVPTR
jgi:Tol biopolymer transport system component